MEGTKPGPAIDSEPHPTPAPLTPRPVTLPTHALLGFNPAAPLQLSRNYWRLLTPKGFRGLYESYPGHFLLDIFPKYPEFHSQQPRNFHLFRTYN